MKRKLLKVFCTILLICILVWIWTGQFIGTDNKSINFEITLESSVVDEYQIFFSPEKHATKDSFSEDKSFVTTLQKTEEDEWFSFSIPADTRYVRFDSGNVTQDYVIKSIVISYDNKKYSISLSQIYLQNDMTSELESNGLQIQREGSDPYLVWDIQHAKVLDMLQKGDKSVFIFRVASTFMILVLCVLAMHKRSVILEELRDIYSNRKIVRDLSKTDFKNKFAGSYLGVFWAFVQPIVIVTIYWFIFSVGFKSAPVDDCPYLLWLISGICPWFFFNDALNAGTNSLYDYSYIVKKVAFKIDIIPIIKIISSAFVHLFFIALVIFVFCLHGQYPTIYTIQVLYYSLCTFVLTLGITYFTSALAVFFKDTTQIVGILLQFGMWMVPIMYSESMFDGKIKSIFFEINPIYYLVNGYRDALISGTWFWERGILTIYFWIITAMLFFIGMLVFRKLRPHFADVI